MPHKYKTVPEQHPFIQVITRFQKSMLHDIPYMLKVHPAILGKLFLFGRVTKFGTSSQFDGILPERLLHTVYIVRFLLTCMYPFIQKRLAIFPSSKGRALSIGTNRLKSNLPDGCHNPCSILPVN